MGAEEEWEVGEDNGCKSNLDQDVRRLGVSYLEKFDKKVIEWY